MKTTLLVFLLCLLTSCAERPTSSAVNGNLNPGTYEIPPIEIETNYQPVPVNELFAMHFKAVLVHCDLFLVDRPKMEANDRANKTLSLYAFPSFQQTMTQYTSNPSGAYAATVAMERPILRSRDLIVTNKVAFQLPTVELRGTFKGTWFDGNEITLDWQAMLDPSSNMPVTALDFLAEKVVSQVHKLTALTQLICRLETKPIPNDDLRK